MSNVVSMEAFRAAIFRGSRENPIYDPRDIPPHIVRTFTPEEYANWRSKWPDKAEAARLDKLELDKLIGPADPWDGGHAA